MKRNIENKLLVWEESSNRMPILLLGARQVGKTYTVFNFAKAHFSSVLMINFDGNTEVQKIFEPNLDPVRIVRELENIYDRQINIETLIFFDEIQACPKALSSLKYFCEQLPDQPIIAAGSLLGIALKHQQVSFPVGKVHRLTMYPMSFDEFLIAIGEERLLRTIIECASDYSPMQYTPHERALSLYNDYLIVGGMPQAVKEYIEKKDMDFVSLTHQNIVLGYRDDMSKYSSLSESSRTRATYNSIPSQLARENTKFIYKLINSNARASAYEHCIDWLSDAGLIIRVNKTNTGMSPLSFREDFSSYKIYMNDVGLLTYKSNIPVSLIKVKNALADYSRGAITENYVAVALSSNDHVLYYWGTNGNAEVDFVIETNQGAIPIEVKSSDNTKSKSLIEFVKKYHPAFSIRISKKNFGFENNIKSIPLYATFCIKK
ncbi:MAG: AAA family ATPase [Christensenellaceae bacterium]|jgi:predicted AAA+ superfamily ATPase|nr:AAA family ATPase [Christensenellaceae bacterium]